MTDERYKQIMTDLGYPNSRTLMCALQQVSNETAHELIATRNDKLNRISTIVDGALVTANMRMNSGPEVFISGERFIRAESLESILNCIAELLRA